MLLKQQMEKNMDLNILEDCILFKEIPKHEIANLLPCLEKRVVEYQKNEIIYHAGDLIDAPGIVLSGSVSIEYNDVWGNKSILDKLEPSQVFAETYACLPNEPLMVDVVANEKTKIFFIKISSILERCPHGCSFHNQLIKNLLTIAAQKNLILSQRSFHHSSKSIRGRLLSFLSFQSKKHARREFNIPFNRQQLADYLNVDRSALSSEISKMQKEGLIKTDKNHFILQNTHFEEQI